MVRFVRFLNALGFLDINGNKGLVIYHGNKLHFIPFDLRWGQMFTSFRICIWINYPGCDINGLVYENLFGHLDSSRQEQLKTDGYPSTQSTHMLFQRHPWQSQAQKFAALARR